MKTKKRIKQVVIVVSGVVALSILIAAVAIISAAEPAELSAAPVSKDGGTVRRVAPASATGSDVAANPELSMLSRYSAAARDQTEFALLAANPELTIARRYLAAAGAVSEASRLASNPELAISRRYVLGEAGRADSTFLAANPEIVLYRHYVAGYRFGVDQREELCCREGQR